MSGPDFTTTFVVDQDPQAVFSAITDVRGWWSGDIDGRTDELGAVFTYRYGDVHYSKQQITELVPGSRVVWHVLDASLSFTEDPDEWKGTDVRFEVTPTDSGTEVRFAHVGLVPDFECFDACSSAWSFYVNGSLRSLITTGEGQPNPVPDPDEAR